MNEDRDEGVLIRDSVLADDELKNKIRTVKEKYFPDRSGTGLGYVPSKLAYEAIKEAKKKDLEPSRVFEVLLDYSEISEEVLKEASERGMDPVDVAKVFRGTEEPYKVLDESKKLDMNPVKVMEVKENFPDTWRKALVKSKEKNLDPFRTAETLTRLPGHVEEALEKASEKGLDPLSTAITLKFYPDVAEESLDLAFTHDLNPNEVAMTKDKFPKEIFDKAIEVAGERKIELYWTAKCFEEYTERRANRIFPEAQEKEANPYILARITFGHGKRHRAEYDVESK